MDAQLVIEIDGETATEHEVILGCSVGAESAIGCDGEWISGYVVTHQWLLAPTGLRVALGADERRAEERTQAGGEREGERAREWRAGVVWVGLVVLWVAALAVVLVGELVRGG